MIIRPFDFQKYQKLVPLFRKAVKKKDWSLIQKEIDQYKEDNSFSNEEVKTSLNKDFIGNILENTVSFNWPSEETVHDIDVIETDFANSILDKTHPELNKYIEKLFKGGDKDRHEFISEHGGIWGYLSAEEVKKCYELAKNVKKEDLFSEEINDFYQFLRELKVASENNWAIYAYYSG